MYSFRVWCFSQTFLTFASCSDKRCKDLLLPNTAGGVDNMNLILPQLQGLLNNAVCSTSCDLLGELLLQ